MVGRDGWFKSSEIGRWQLTDRDHQWRECSREIANRCYSYRITFPIPEAGKTRIFNSDTYHYQFSYPDDWKIQVNAALPSGAGSNPEYVTMTGNDGSNPPQIAV
jgi:hypothetical protein